MADTKISALTTTTALTGAELIPLVQNGNTLNASAATIANQLPATGVTPGNYTNANISVNAKGQVTSAANGTTGGATGLLPANNLSDLTSVTTARTNLGLGTAAILAAGSANGAATLDGSGKLTAAQIPASIVGAVVYQGTWNASTNTPTLASGVGTKGFYYKVSVAGTTAIDGISNWSVGDDIIFDGTTWDKIDGSQSASAGSAGIVINGGGAAIATGIAGDLVMPYAGTITGAELLADQAGSIVIDVWKSSYANYPPTVSNSIAGSALPTLSGAIKGVVTTLTGWTTAVNAGDILRFNVNSASTVTRVTLVLNITKS